MAIFLQAGIDVDPYLKKYYRHSIRYKEVGSYLRLAYHALCHIVDQVNSKCKPEIADTITQKYLPQKQEDTTKTLTIYYPNPPSSKEEKSKFITVALSAEFNASIKSMMRYNFVNDLTVFCLSNQQNGSTSRMVRIFLERHDITESDLKLDTAIRMVRKKPTGRTRNLTVPFTINPF